jgi:hypothetical protein
VKGFTCGLIAWLAIGCAAAEAQWLNYPTPGIPRLADGKPDLKAPAPRLPDGRPDLSGIWEGWATGPQGRFFDLAAGLDPADVQMTPWAAAISAQRAKRDHVDDPLGFCMPPGMPRIDFVDQFKIVQTPMLTVLLHEAQVGMMFRQVFTDGRPLPVDPNPSWLGYSIGRWDGDTFVVETIGLRDRGWLDVRTAHPHSDALRVTERFRRLNVGQLELKVTIDDPKAYLKPWTQTTILPLMADTELLESFCDNHELTLEHRTVEPAPPEPPSPPVLK